MLHQGLLVYHMWSITGLKTLQTLTLVPQISLHYRDGD